MRGNKPPSLMVAGSCRAEQWQELTTRDGRTACRNMGLAGMSPVWSRRKVQAMPDTQELQTLLTAMAESEPEPGKAEQTEFGTIAWYLATQ